MYVLAQTSEYLAEHEAGLLSISRNDGMALSMVARGHISGFRECVSKHGPARTVDTYIRMMLGAGIEWAPMYKPSHHRARS